MKFYGFHFPCRVELVLTAQQLLRRRIPLRGPTTPAIPGCNSTHRTSVNTPGHIPAKVPPRFRHSKSLPQPRRRRTSQFSHSKIVHPVRQTQPLSPLTGLYYKNSWDGMVPPSEEITLLPEQRQRQEEEGKGRGMRRQACSRHLTLLRMFRHPRAQSPMETTRPRVSRGEDAVKRCITSFHHLRPDLLQATTRAMAPRWPPLGEGFIAAAAQRCQPILG